MSLLFLKRVLANPLRVGYVVPSSPFLTRQTARRLDFSQPRVVVELGPGEGCHTREIVKRMDAKSRLILFELDEEFVSHLRKQFVRDPRVTVLNTDALRLPETLQEMGHSHCDYIISGLPFFFIEPSTKRQAFAEHCGSYGPRQPLHYLPGDHAALRPRSPLRIGR